MAYLSIFYIAIVFMFSFGYRQNQPHALIKLYIYGACSSIYRIKYLFCFGTNNFDSHHMPFVTSQLINYLQQITNLSGDLPIELSFAHNPSPLPTVHPSILPPFSPRPTSSAPLPHLVILMGCL